MTCHLLTFGVPGLTNMQMCGGCGCGRLANLFSRLFLEREVFVTIAVVPSGTLFHFMEMRPVYIDRDFLILSLISSFIMRGADGRGDNGSTAIYMPMDMLRRRLTPFKHFTNSDIWPSISEYFQARGPCARIRFHSDNGAT